ncbi:ABC transporter permease [Actinoplanes regularis]|uniref:ABC transporter permease n=1 Tax=Actinoplanes regularis TaxID=52697 RepID=UPI0024A0EF39|nr:ABC transporter permease [Actinoplanes regularis]GLW30167.1 ABC transporter permease [Actinoplanes regularis]
MTAPSAYPRTVEDLIPHARDLAARLGEIPSRNKLMSTFKIGGPKANELLAALAPAPAAPTDPEPTADPALPVESNPPAVDDLIPAAVELTRDRRGELPTLGLLMERFAIAEPVAAEILAHLQGLAAKDADRIAYYAYAVKLGRNPAPLTLHLVRRPVDEPEPAPPEPSTPTIEPIEPPTGEPVDQPAPKRRRPVVWPVLVLCLPAFVAIWGGWVEMGRLTGFGMVTLLPGISDFQINTAITLPIGVETYAAYALYVWLSGMVAGVALKFAKWSALASLLLGALGQVAYHLMAAAGWISAPWWITAVVACIPVAVLGMGAGLAHLMHRSH